MYHSFKSLKNHLDFHLTQSFKTKVCRFQKKISVLIKIVVLTNRDHKSLKEIMIEESFSHVSYDWITSYFIRRPFMADALC